MPRLVFDRLVDKWIWGLFTAFGNSTSIFIARISSERRPKPPMNKRGRQEFLARFESARGVFYD